MNAHNSHLLTICMSGYQVRERKKAIYEYMRTGAKHITLLLDAGGDN